MSENRRIIEKNKRIFEQIEIGISEEETVTLKADKACRANAIYLSPDEVSCIREKWRHKSAKSSEEVQTTWRVEEVDTLTRATVTAEVARQSKRERKVVALNFANPFEPGGGVYRGARAQEEDLCLRSSLLFSLESEEARPFYELHKSQNHYMASDALVLSPCVEVIRYYDDALFAESECISVLSCAAPMARKEKGNLTGVLRKRIEGMLCVAAEYGYEVLVLGAWGCGAFGNNPKVVASLFREVLNEYSWFGFDAVFFSIRESPNKDNLNAFLETFGECDERTALAREHYLVASNLRKTLYEWQFYQANRVLLRIFWADDLIDVSKTKEKKIYRVRVGMDDARYECNLEIINKTMFYGIREIHAGQALDLFTVQYDDKTFLGTATCIAREDGLYENEYTKAYVPDRTDYAMRALERRKTFVPLFDYDEWKVMQVAKEDDNGNTLYPYFVIYKDRETQLRPDEMNLPEELLNAVTAGKSI